MDQGPQGRRALLRLAGVILLTALLCLAGWLLMRASVSQMFRPNEGDEPPDLESAGPENLP